MVDLTTTYMGLQLNNPVVPSASPLSGTLDSARRLEDAGAAAITLASLFEEQIEAEAQALGYFLERGTYSNPEALTYFPPLREYRREPEQYVNYIRSLKESLQIPVIASLNAASPGGWTRYARLFEEAGADAIELNVYFLPADPETSGQQIENRYVQVLQEVKAQVRIPVAVKLSPFWSALPNFAARLDNSGADGLVLFNRFYQPDIDIEALDVTPSLRLSTSTDLRLPLRWIAILHGRVRSSLALSSGVHSPEDVVKAVMAGADVANVCSLLLRDGISTLAALIAGLTHWMEEHEYESVRQMKGSMSHRSCPDPSAFERANYQKVLLSWQGIP